MEIFNQMIEWVFTIALLLNALLFIPQAVKIIKTKSAQGLSFLTFLGFLLIQLAILLHGLVQGDYLLSLGYLPSLFTCGLVVLLILYYQNRDSIPLAPQIAERLEMLENIIALMPGHVYWVDREGLYLGCNEIQAKSAGLASRTAILGKKNKNLPWNFNTEILPESLDKINQEVMETGKTLLLEEPARLQDGRELTFLSHKVPLYNQLGHIIGMVGISIDITDRKKAEAALLLEKIRAEAANQAKSAFLANMRHDIRTALTGMVGLSELLTSETNLSKIHYFSENLNKSTLELLRFLSEILEWIEIASGEIPLLNKKFKLKDTLENVLELHKPMAIQKQLQLSLKLDKNLPQYLIGDSVRIYRIMLELLANALKFTQTGSVSIFASLVKKARQTAIIKFVVEDTGIGITEDKQSTLFVPFNRLTPSYQGIYKGTGLGLSIVKQFIEDLNGEIYVESQLNKGSQFVCILPLKRCLLETSASVLKVKYDKTNS